MFKTQERAQISRVLHNLAEAKRSGLEREQRTQRTQGLSQWDNYRKEVDRLKNLAVLKYKERFSCRRLITVLCLYRLGPRMKQRLSEKRVNRLYDDARFKLALKMKILATRRRRRYGATIEQRLKAFHLRPILCLYVAAVHAAWVKRNSLIVHKLLTSALDKARFQQKCEHLYECVEKIQ